MSNNHMSEEIVHDSSEDSDNAGEQTSSQATSEDTTPASLSDEARSPKRKQSPERRDVQPPNKKLKSSKAQPTRILPKPFAAPAGFAEAIPQAAKEPSGVSEMFDDLEGKQIWHITAPASLPITSIESFNLQSALKGKAVLEHNGIKYNMRRDQSQNETLLRRIDKGSDYVTSPATISRSYHLVEMSMSEANPPISMAHDADNVSFSAEKTGSRKAPRQQPTGLMMRYKPFGLGSNEPETLKKPDLDSVDDENDEISSNAENHNIVSTPNPKTKKTKESQHSSVGNARTSISPMKHLDKSKLASIPSTNDLPTSKSGNKKKRKERATIAT